MNKKYIWGLVVIIVVASGLFFMNKTTPDTTGPIKIGWISDLTGPSAKYGSIEAARIAVDEINQSGGINGRNVALVEENGLCEAKATVSATTKLVNIDKVKYILGGHCSTESIAAAPIAEKAKVILLASITTSPVYTNSGDYAFRTSPVSLQQAALVADYAVGRNLKKFGVIYENKDYPRPIAEAFKKSLEEKGGTVAVYEGYMTEQNDFRSILLKMKQAGVDAIYASPQSPDKATIILKQIKELGLGIPVFGNEQTGAASITGGVNEGVIYGEPAFNTQDPKTKALIDEYNKRYGVATLPFGIWTAESYDAVHILANAIKETGGDVEKVKAYLYEVKDYMGASGNITIDQNGDGIRTYALKTIKGGKSVLLSSVTQ